MSLAPDSFLDICIALSISILALFIPLFYSVVIRLDEKYESRLIIKSFWSEKVVRFFIVTSILLVISTLIYSLKLKPLICPNSFWIINSAPIISGLLIITSVTLGLLSVFKLNHYQDPVKYFELVKRLSGLSEKEKRIIRFDLLFHSLKDLNYNKDFTKSISDEIDNEIKTIIRIGENLPVEYYDALEQLTSLVFSNSFNNDARHNRHLIFRLWGNIFFSKFPLSENSYSWLWYHLIQAIDYDRDELVLRHWERAHGIIKMNGLISHKRTYRELSQDILEADKNDSAEFIRFHIVLGALLLYTEKFKLLQNCLKYTSSWPPDYYLLPTGSHQIIEIFQFFNDPYDRNYISISSKFPFPGSTGFEQDKMIIRRINQYLILLLFRSKTDLIEKSIFNFKQLDKFKCTDYIKALDILILELTNTVDLDTINKTLERTITKEEVDALKNKLEILKTEISEFRKTLMSNEPLDKQKVIDFCTKIHSNLLPTFKELKKLNVDNSGKTVLNYSGIINIVDKDFFVSENEVSYIDFEESFSSMFSENFKMNLSYVIQQSSIGNYTLKTENIKQIIDELKSNIIIVNFGVAEIAEIEDERIIQLGFTYNVNPRLFLFVDDSKCKMSVVFKQPEIDMDYSYKQPILENNLIIGVEKLSTGQLSERFSEAISADTDLENTIGIEIGSNINITISDSFKSICLIEHQQYWDSKNPDELSSGEIFKLINVSS